jgi:hypothetical protein
MTDPTMSKGAPLTLDVPNAKGVVTLIDWKASRPGIAVGGIPLRRSFGNSYFVPVTRGEAVRLRIRSGMPGYVRVLWGPKELANTGRAPAWMWMLTLAPILLLLFLPGLVGLVIAVGAIFANRVIVSSERIPIALRLLLPIVVFGLGFIAEVAILYAVYGPVEDAALPR